MIRFFIFVLVLLTVVSANRVEAVITLEAATEYSGVITTGGYGTWTGQIAVSHDGGDAGQSSAISNNQLTWMQSTVTGPITLSFWWKVSSESGYDFLSFYLDGVKLGEISGEAGWTQASGIPISSGSHTIKWEYSKDGSTASGSDAGWVDGITLAPSLEVATEYAGTLTTGGNGTWTGQTVVNHDGVDAAQNRVISNNQVTWMQSTVTGPGNLNYWWKVSSESGYDYLRVYLDGVQLYQISGEVGWTQVTGVSIPSGSHTIKWEYSKDGSTASGSDAGWVDGITFITTVVSYNEERDSIYTTENGSVYAFQSDQPLLSNDTNGTIDVYLKDKITGGLSLISKNIGDSSILPNNSSIYFDYVSGDGIHFSSNPLSSDGRYCYFIYNDDGGKVLLRRDTLLNITEIVSVDNVNNSDVTKSLYAYTVTTSSDGRYALFCIHADGMVNGNYKWVLRDMVLKTSKYMIIERSYSGYIRLYLAGDGNKIFIQNFGYSNTINPISYINSIDFNDNASPQKVIMNGIVDGNTVPMNEFNNVQQFQYDLNFSRSAKHMLATYRSLDSYALLFVNMETGVANFVTPTSYGAITNDKVIASSSFDTTPFSISDDGKFLVFTYGYYSGNFSDCVYIVNTTNSEVRLLVGMGSGRATISSDGTKIVASGKMIFNPFISISASPTTISFGQVDTTTPAVPRTVTVTNRDVSAATLGTSALGGSNLGDFSVISDSCSGQSLASGASCTLIVRFVPTLPGAKTATLTINDAAQKPVATVALSGTAPSAPTTDDHGGTYYSNTVVTDNSQTYGWIQNELYPASYDEDVFKFTATRNGTYTIYTTGNLDTYGQVCDATGQTCDYDDDSGSYPNFLIRKTMIAGEVAYVGVTSQLASGNYTLQIDPPLFPLAASGLYLFTPIYPLVDTQPSTIMQGGKVKRYYKVALNLLGLFTAAADRQFNYQMCSETILGTSDCSGVKTATSTTEGYIGFETDWITDPPGTTINRFIKFVNFDGTPDTLVNAISPSFDIMVYPRSLKEENSLTFGANVGAGITEGIGGKVAGLGMRVELAKAGMLGEGELGATISFDTNEFGAPYSGVKSFDSVKLGFDLGYGLGVGAKVEGGLKGEFLGSKVTLASAGGGAKISLRESRNDEFPEFFSSDEILKSEVQAYAFAGRLLNATGLSMAGGASFFALQATTDYLLNKNGLQTDYRKESSYEVKSSFNADISGPTFDINVGGLKLGELKTIGVNGDLVMSFNEGISLNASDQYTNKRVELAYSKKITWPEFKLNIPKIPELSLSAKLVQGTGGKYTNEVTMRNGRVDQIKLSMTTDLKTTEMLAFVLDEQRVVENRITVYTTDPGYAQKLSDNHIGVGVLVGFGLLGSVVNSTLNFDVLNTDLLSVLDYTRTSSLEGYVNSPLEYYNSHAETVFTDFLLPLELAAGVYIELGAKIGVVRSANQVQTKGASTAYGHFETEEYQLDDAYINSKKKSMSDVNAVYGKYITEAINAVVNKIKGAIDSTKVVVGNLVDGGIEAVKKTGDAFNWLSYHVHLATTKAIPSGQQVMALQSAPASGMTANAVTLAAGTAVTIGQNHFVNVLDPNGVDLMTFPAPITISLGYKLTDLTAAGLTLADADKLRIYRWNDTYGIWVYQGGAVNTVAQSVSVDITAKGSFILAIDTVAPVVSNFVASDTTTTPILTAVIKDSLSGINTDTFSMTVDGLVVVNSANWQNYFNPATGAFIYKPVTALAAGDHIAILTVSDSGGNTTPASLSFTVNALLTAITHTPPSVANAGSPIAISATNTGSTGITEAWLAYRLGTASELKYQQLVGNGTVYSGVIPAIDTNGKQVFYYLYFRDVNGYDVYSPALAPASYYTVALNSGVTRTINIFTEGTGTGTINATGLTCSAGICTGTYAAGAVVQLAPAADITSFFGGWSGEACSGINSCSVTMNTNLNLTAPFFKRIESLTVSLTGDGSGSVNSSPATEIACMKGGDSGCSAVFANGTSLTLTATADSTTSNFGGWSNACTSVPCVITMTAAKTAVATFNLAPKIKLDVNAATGYTAFTDAYANATSSMYSLQDILLGDWTLAGSKAIILTGGYQADYKARTGYTTLKGKLSIKNGSLRLDGVKIR